MYVEVRSGHVSVSGFKRVSARKRLSVCCCCCCRGYARRNEIRSWPVRGGGDAVVHRVADITAVPVTRHTEMC